jgi:hypothetical protein
MLPLRAALLFPSLCPACFMEWILNGPYHAGIYACSRSRVKGVGGLPTTVQHGIPQIKTESTALIWSRERFLNTRNISGERLYRREKCREITCWIDTSVKMMLYTVINSQKDQIEILKKWISHPRIESLLLGSMNWREPDSKNKGYYRPLNMFAWNRYRAASSD